MEVAILILVLGVITAGILAIRKQTRKVRKQMMDEMKDMD